MSERAARSSHAAKAQDKKPAGVETDPVEMDLYRCKTLGHHGVVTCLRCGEILAELDDHPSLEDPA